MKVVKLDGLVLPEKAKASIKLLGQKMPQVHRYINGESSTTPHIKLEDGIVRCYEGGDRIGVETEKGFVIVSGGGDILSLSKKKRLSRTKNILSDTARVLNSAAKNIPESGNVFVRSISSLYGK